MKHLNKLLLAVAVVAVPLVASAEDRRADEQIQAAVSTKSRAEVRAELALWQRAGLTQLTADESFEPYSPQVQRAEALFARWMNGPEYVAELRRQGADATTMAAVRAAPSTN